MLGEDTAQTTTSLAMPGPKISETVWAVRQQLNRRLRCLISMIDQTSSCDGLLGPDLPFFHAQKSKRYLLFSKASWRLSSVDDRRSASSKAHGIVPCYAYSSLL